ncbi:pyridoxal phosphate-dependent aminotransferase [Pseudobacteroides cellulosolvens]|uniref:Aminotransferase class I and II n=1 Tax=Pseudobacteroides cellulosolvens ATCC 35603 = DSM 2933 TaxID=398512 RepID=A0A0L6JQM6_9FIRM|nr:threonine-phosphate decarboxylase [Pseudobacteroides cellulosolvens]KNY27995.1 aminotransferase class I and II [Pseudobacteroides cellulosolvens ATCC 35603 = DSM 2933]
MEEGIINETVQKHGGNIYRASQRYGIRKEDFLDYSANINPLGIPEELRELIISNMDLLSSYPDPECNDLRKDISLYLDVPRDRIIIGNGAAEVIFLLFDELKPKKVLIPSPTFCEYERAASKSGSEVVFYRIKESKGFKLDVHELISSMNDNDADSLILCNPNNPTSVLTSPDDLLNLLKAAYRKGIKVIIDETFVELTIGGNLNSMTAYLREFDNLFIIRAFTKLFAIPGLRLGYGLGNKALISNLWKRKVTWSVNCFAGISGLILRNKHGYLDRTTSWLSKEIDHFYNDLCNLKKVHVFKPNTNFILLKIKDKKTNSYKLRESMAFKGVLIRDASNFRFLDDSFIRVAIKDRDSNEKFIEILNEVI